MTKQFADLWQGRTLLQHANGQGVAELMRPLVRRIDAGATQRVANDRPYAV